ncbi:MAG: hypothetical protein WA775_03140 [Psychroserpens sp.]|uniref:hypothetical protein n=1 Tax=Psychroserpens sp. TaxID=2020870 RepID=UPI003C79259E
MDDKIDATLAYYQKKEEQILNEVNANKNLSAEAIIHYGEELAIIMYKITALEIAKEN